MKKPFSFDLNDYIVSSWDTHIERVEGGWKATARRRYPTPEITLEIISDTKRDAQDIINEMMRGVDEGEDDGSV